MFINWHTDRSTQMIKHPFPLDSFTSVSQTASHTFPLIMPPIKQFFLEQTNICLTIHSLISCLICFHSSFHALHIASGETSSPSSSFLFFLLLPRGLHPHHDSEHQQQHLQQSDSGGHLGQLRAGHVQEEAEEPEAILQRQRGRGGGGRQQEGAGGGKTGSSTYQQVGR